MLTGSFKTVLVPILHTVHVPDASHCVDGLQIRIPAITIELFLPTALGTDQLVMFRSGEAVLRDVVSHVDTAEEEVHILRRRAVLLQLAACCCWVGGSPERYARVAAELKV